MNGQKSFRSILSLVLAVLLVCAAAGCANTGAPAQSGTPAGMRVTVRQKAFETEERMAFEWAESGEAAIASGVYTAVEIDDASAERFPKLAEALAQRNKSYDDGFLPMFADLAAMARDSQGEPWGGAPMTEERVIEIGRADSAILSMMVTMSGYYGGAHPLTYFYSENYVPETGAEWGCILGLAVICSAFGLTLQPVAQSHTTPERAGLLCAISPVSASLMSMLFMGERLGVSGLIGAALIMSSIFIPKLETVIMNLLGRLRIRSDSALLPAGNRRVTLA